MGITDSIKPGQSEPASHSSKPVSPVAESNCVAIDIYKTLDKDELREHGVEQAFVRNSSPNDSKRHKGKIKFKVLDGTSSGNYERSPSYQCSSQVVLADEVSKDKYCGDYERDPNYVSRLASKQRFVFDPSLPTNYEWDQNYASQSAPKMPLNFDPSLPHRIPHPAEVLVHHKMPSGSDQVEKSSKLHEDERTDKYRGNYERSETYVLPPRKAQQDSLLPLEGGRDMRGRENQVRIMLSGDGNRLVVLDGKYRGDYERSPVYMEKMLQGVSNSPPSTYTSSCRDVAVPAMPSNQGYTTLEPTMIQQLQPYTTTLTHAYSAPGSGDGSGDSSQPDSLSYLPEQDYIPDGSQRHRYPPDCELTLPPKSHFIQTCAADLATTTSSTHPNLQHECRPLPLPAMNRDFCRS